LQAGLSFSGEFLDFFRIAPGYNQRALNVRRERDSRRGIRPAISSR
jgi:hypothetical protein